MTLWEQGAVGVGIGVAVAGLGFLAAGGPLFRLRARRRLKEVMSLEVPDSWDVHYEPSKGLRLLRGILAAAAAAVIGFILNDAVAAAACLVCLGVAFVPLLALKGKGRLDRFSVRGDSWLLFSRGGETWQVKAAEIRRIEFWSFRAYRGIDVYIPCMTAATFRNTEPLEAVMLSMSDYVRLKKYALMYGIDMNDAYGKAIGRPHWEKGPAQERRLAGK